MATARVHCMQVAREALGAHLKLAQQTLTGAADRAASSAVAALPPAQPSSSPAQVKPRLPSVCHKLLKQLPLMDMRIIVRGASQRPAQRLETSTNATQML